MRLKFVADVNVEKSIVDYLSGAGYDVKWVPDYDCRMSDDDLLELARSEHRVLITNDKDFGEFFYNCQWERKSVPVTGIEKCTTPWEREFQSGEAEIVVSPPFWESCLAKA